MYIDNEFIYINEVKFNISMRASYDRSEIGFTVKHVIGNIKSVNIYICCGIYKMGIIAYELKHAP